MFRRCAVASAAFMCSSYLFCSKPHSNLYEWGNGVYQPRAGHPNDILNFSNFSIKKVASFSEEDTPSLKHLSYGPLLTAAIDKKGDLYVYPIHETNNVQVEEVDDSKREASLLHSGGNFVSATFTMKGVLFALNESGEVWQWRFDRDPEAKARRIPSLSNIVQIASGNDHFVALDKEGRVWTMGDDTFGQCGIGRLGRQLREPYFEVRYPNPTCVTGLPLPVTQVACGAQHTLVILNNGEVYGWGRNNKRQVGPTEETVGSMPLPVCYTPVPIICMAKHQVAKVAAGDYFSVYVTVDGAVYGSGLNIRGQLGTGFLTHIVDSAEISGLSHFVVRDGDKERDVKITQLACGAEHCIALLDVDAVYSWGGNEFGEQGNKKRAIVDRPSLLKPFRNQHIEGVFAGKHCSAVISEPVPPKSA